MRIATWNIERLKHKAEADKIYSEIEGINADILVLTETDTRISPKYEYVYSTPLLAEEQPDYYRETENRVSIYTNYPCTREYATYDNRTAICVGLDTEDGELLIYGTIMGIFGNREKSFKTDLVKQMSDIRALSSDGKCICVIGDYNLSFCDNYYYTKFGRDTVEETFSQCGISILTRDKECCVDHIAVSQTFMKGQDVGIAEWNLERTLSDHKGIVADI